jgi:Calpain family cysteine protease
MDAFLRYGFEAAESFLEALAPHTAAVLTPAASPSSTPGTAAQPAPAQPITEPDPDLDSGQGAPGPVVQGAGLGDALYLQEPKGAPPFVNGVQVRTEEVRQGFLLNCPLPAAMAAMAHVPAGQKKIREMIDEVPGPVDSKRQRKTTEYFTNQQPKTLRAEQFVSSRSFDVKLRGGTVRVTPQLYHNLQNNDRLHYSRSEDGALWPGLIEKAYVVSQGNTYQSINGSFSAVKALEALHGPASEVRLKPDLKNNTLIGILKKHDQRPTIAGSLEDQEDATITGHHAYAVVDFEEKAKKVKLYDALDGKTVELSLDDFRRRFGEVVFAK